MAFLLKPMNFSEKLSANYLTQITEKIIEFEFFGLWPLNLAELKSLKSVSKLHVFPLKQLFLQICDFRSV